MQGSDSGKEREKRHKDLVRAVIMSSGEEALQVPHTIERRREEKTESEAEAEADRQESR